MCSKSTPAERAQAGGSGPRLSSFRMPERVQIIEKTMRAELADALPQDFTRETKLQDLVNTVILLTQVMQIILSCETHSRVHTLGGLEAPMEAARTFTGAMAALRAWHYRLSFNPRDVPDEPRTPQSLDVREVSCGSQA